MLCGWARTAQKYHAVCDVTQCDARRECVAQALAVSGSLPPAQIAQISSLASSCTHVRLALNEHEGKKGQAVSQESVIFAPSAGKVAEDLQFFRSVVAADRELKPEEKASCDEWITDAGKSGTVMVVAGKFFLSVSVAA